MLDTMKKMLTFHNDESTLLQDFSNYVVSKDPDIIIFKNYDLTVLNYLLERIKILSLDLQLGRWKTDIYSSRPETGFTKMDSRASVPDSE